MNASYIIERMGRKGIGVKLFLIMIPAACQDTSSCCIGTMLMVLAPGQMSRGGWGGGAEGELCVCGKICDEEVEDGGFFSWWEGQMEVAG